MAEDNPGYIVRGDGRPPVRIRQREKLERDALKAEKARFDAEKFDYRKSQDEMKAEMARVRQQIGVEREADRKAALKRDLADLNAKKRAVTAQRSLQRSQLRSAQRMQLQERFDTVFGHRKIMSGSMGKLSKAYSTIKNDPFERLDIDRNFGSWGEKQFDIKWPKLSTGDDWEHASRQIYDYKRKHRGKRKRSYHGKRKVFKKGKKRYRR